MRDRFEEPLVPQGSRDNKLGIARDIVDEFKGFDPARPDPLEAFALRPARRGQLVCSGPVRASEETPYGVTTNKTCGLDDATRTYDTPESSAYENRRT